MVADACRVAPMVVFARGRRHAVALARVKPCLDAEDAGIAIKNGDQVWITAQVCDGKMNWYEISRTEVDVVLGLCVIVWS